MHGLANSWALYLEAAKAHFIDTVKLDPTYGEAYYGWAMALKKQGRAAEAVEPLRRAIELRPNWVEALNELTLILAAHAESTSQH